MGDPRAVEKARKSLAKLKNIANTTALVVGHNHQVKYNRIDSLLEKKNSLERQFNLAIKDLEEEIERSREVPDFRYGSDYTFGQIK
jgi:hypothetical protein